MVPAWWSLVPQEAPETIHQHNGATDDCVRAASLAAALLLTGRERARGSYLTSLVYNFILLLVWYPALTHL